MAFISVVTGASAGLGVEFARLLAQDKQALLLVARREDRLKQLAAELNATYGVQVEIHADDLMDAGAPKRVMEKVHQLNAHVDVLVNNAGFGTSGPYVASNLERELGMVALNVSAVMALTRAVLPEMVARRQGRILNVGSTAGFQPGPSMAGYYATKAFVNSFSEALSYELRGTGVTVTLSCPGPTSTEFGEVAGNGKSRLFQMGAMSAVDVATEAYQAMKNGDRRVIHGFVNRVSAMSTGVMPNRVLLWLVSLLNRRA
jgi:short-subunit dehydrogenase